MRLGNVLKKINRVCVNEQNKTEIISENEKKKKDIMLPPCTNSCYNIINNLACDQPAN